MILSENFFGEKKYSRIISLVPSQTELLAYLGLDEQVIGITKFCIHPAKWFKEKTRIGGTKNVNLEKIHSLVPDLIIANKEENQKEQILQLSEKHDVFVTDVNNLNDALKMINSIGTLTGFTEKAFSLSSKIHEGFEKLSNGNSGKRKIRAAYFIWKDPWMVAASQTFINEMMMYSGMENVFGHLQRYPKISIEELQQHNPELILLSTEPYPFNENHRTEIKKLFPEKKIEIVDGEMFSWYGSRLLKSVEYFHSFSKKH